MHNDHVVDGLSSTSHPTDATGIGVNEGMGGVTQNQPDFEPGITSHVPTLHQGQTSYAATIITPGGDTLSTMSGPMSAGPTADGISSTSLGRTSSTNMMPQNHGTQSTHSGLMHRARVSGSDFGHRISELGENISHHLSDMLHTIAERALSSRDTIMHSAVTSRDSIMHKATDLTDAVKHADYPGMVEDVRTPIRRSPERTLMACAAVGLALGFLAPRPRRRRY